MPRINPHKQAVNTRMLYTFETEFFNQKQYKHLLKQRSKKSLIEIAEAVWKKEGKGYPIPEIRFGKGVNHRGDYVSWCNGPIIELAPDQRDLITLLHELAHAKGNYLHNHKFVGTYIKFLTRYAEIDKDELLTYMEMHKVDIPRHYKKHTTES